MRKDKIIISKEILEESYSRLGSLNKVGKELGVSAKTVKRRMKEFDLEYLPKKQYSCNEKFFNSINEKSAYWAGFIIADGCVRKHNYSYEISINLATRDRDQLIKFNNELESDYPIHDYAKKAPMSGIIKNTNKIYYSSSLIIRSKLLFDDLNNNFGVTPRKTYTCHFPDKLCQNEYVRHFIRGIFDGDGWISYNKKNRKVSIGICGTYHLMKGCRDIINDNISFSDNSGNFYQKGKIWYLEYGGRNIVKEIILFLYKNCNERFLNRKKEIADKIALIPPPDSLDSILTYEVLKESYKKAGQIKAVAKKLGHRPDTIKKYMKKNGISWYKKPGHKQNHNFFSKKNESEKQFYWAGFLLGKSSINEKTNCIRVSLKDDSLLHKFKNSEITNSPICKPGYISFSSETIIKDLKRFGIQSNKNNRYEMPMWLLNHEFLMSFLKGRFDSKGYFSDKRIEITGPILFLYQIRDIFKNHIGVFSYPKIYSRNNSNRITYSNKSARDIFDFFTMREGF